MYSGPARTVLKEVCTLLARTLGRSDARFQCFKWPSSGGLRREDTQRGRRQHLARADTCNVRSPVSSSQLVSVSADPPIAARQNESDSITPASLPTT